jgi:glycosyltransferase involved in cell wall biosynthesis
MVDVLCFSSTDWEGVWGSRQQVMLRLARRGYRILFVEQAAGLEHLWRYPALWQRKWRRWREGVREAADNVWIASLPPLLPGRYYRREINAINQSLTIRWTWRWLAKLDFAPDLLWLYKPEQGPLIGRFGEKLSVYHCIDEFTAGTTGRKRAMIELLEGDLLRRVDLVFANSRLTFENKRALHGQTFRIPSGVDAAHFARAADESLAVHPAVAGLKRPCLGYVGNINERLDYDALTHLAEQRPDCSLVLVGDTYPWTMDAPPLQRLAALSNVHFLGQFPFAELPALVKGLAVCLVPYVADERAYFRSPLKLYEYLAAGKPVAATAHPEAEEFGELIYLAESPADYVLAVTRALSEDNAARQQARLAAARQHDWDGRVTEMEKHIRQALREKGFDDAAAH